METSDVKTSAVTETGHAKNLSNFKAIIAAATSFGDTYNPQRIELTVPEISTLADKCESAISDVSLTKAAYKVALDARNSVFEILNKKTTRVINALKACSTTDHLDKSARELARKIQGSRAKQRRSEEEKKADHEAGIMYNEISASQMSYDSRAGHFAELVKFLSSIPQYKPNETEFQVESLKAYSDDLVIKNTAVVNTMVALNNARAARNDLMYKPVMGMVDLALDIKSYLKSVFGPSSLQYKKVGRLDFTKYKN